MDWREIKGATSVVHIDKANGIVEKTIVNQEYWEHGVLEREYRWLQKLGHLPFFPAVLGYDYVARKIYTTYEGVPIDRAVAGTPNVPWQAQMKAILAALVEANCTHCDIKPAEILVDENARLHLVDFGWAVPCGNVPPEYYSKLGVGAQFRDERNVIHDGYAFRKSLEVSGYA